MKNLKAKVKILLMFLVLALTTTNMATAAENTAVTEQARALAIKDRIYEIKAMDYSHLSKAERKNIRQELRGINKELRQMHHPTYVYIGGGTLILLIILLLILL